MTVATTGTGESPRACTASTDLSNYIHSANCARNTEAGPLSILGALCLCSVPGVWLHPGSRQLYIIDGHGNSAGSLGGDDECVISEALVVEEKVQIRIEMRQKVVDVFLNDEPTARCSEPRADRRPFDNVRVFASDGFYPAANGLLDNFYWGANLMLFSTRSCCVTHLIFLQSLSIPWWAAQF
eukprot:SAG31_NODE_974_length_10627_cov_11.246201_7_plen_183_part_00